MTKCRVHIYLELECDAKDDVDAAQTLESRIEALLGDDYTLLKSSIIDAMEV